MNCSPHCTFSELLKNLGMDVSTCLCIFISFLILVLFSSFSSTSWMQFLQCQNFLHHYDKNFIYSTILASLQLHFMLPNSFFFFFLLLRSSIIMHFTANQFRSPRSQNIQNYSPYFFVLSCLFAGPFG